VSLGHGYYCCIKERTEYIGRQTKHKMDKFAFSKPVSELPHSCWTAD